MRHDRGISPFRPQTSKDSWVRWSALSALVYVACMANAMSLTAQPSGSEHYEGTVLSIRKESFILGRPPRIEREIHLSQETRFYRGAARIEFSKMRVGDSADVTGQMRQNEVWAQRVQLHFRAKRSRIISTSGSRWAFVAQSLVVKLLQQHSHDTTETAATPTSDGTIFTGGPDFHVEGVDCSHFVNDIYARAGLDYTYADSRELYRGVPDFVRTVVPQTGGLIVWPGHVGIILDPVGRTFLSVLRGGLRVSRWRSTYWRQRGNPIFYQHIRLAGNLVSSDGRKVAGEQAGVGGQE